MESRCFDEDSDEKLIDLVREHPVLYEIHHKSYRDNTVRENVWKEIALSLYKSVPDCKMRWRTIRDSYRKNKNKLKTGCKAGSAAFAKSKYNNENLKFLDESFKERITKSSTDILNSIYEDENHEEEIGSENIGIHEGIVDDENLDGCLAYKDELTENELEYAVNLRRCTVAKKAKLISTNLEELPRKKPNLKCTKESMIDKIKKEPDERGNILEDLHGEKQMLTFPEHPIETFFKSMARTVLQFPPHFIAETRMKVCQIVTEMELRALSERQQNTLFHQEPSWPNVHLTSSMVQTCGNSFLLPHFGTSAGSVSSNSGSSVQSPNDSYDMETSCSVKSES